VRVAAAFEQVLGRVQNADEVTRAERVGEGEVGRLRAGGDQAFDVCGADPLSVGPGGELVDLRAELVDVVADELEQGAAGVGLGARAVQAELLGDPFLQPPLGNLPEQELALTATTAFAIGASFASSPPTRASVVSGAGARR